MVVDSGPLHPLAMCCHNAFWDMSRVEVGKLAALKGIQMPQGATLFSTLLTAIIGILDVDEITAMDYVGKRLPPSRNDQHFGEILTELDSALEVIDSNDRQGFKDEMKTAETKRDMLDGVVLKFQ